MQLFVEIFEYFCYVTQEETSFIDSFAYFDKIGCDGQFLTCPYHSGSIKICLEWGKCWLSYLLTHCGWVTPVLLPVPIVTCGGGKIGWRAIAHMFTSPTWCPQAFRLVTHPTSTLTPHHPLPPHMTPSCFYCPCYIDLWNFQKFVEYDESPCKAYEIGKTWQIDHSNKILNSKLSAPDAFSPPFPLLPCGFYSPAKWDNTNLRRILWRQNTKRKYKNYYLERLIQTIPTIKFYL